MKKYIVLAILFIFPLVVYLFFASGVNRFAKLPVLTKNVQEISAYSDAQFKDRITVLGFFGNVLQDKKALALNLNQKIYKRFYKFTDFQFLIALPEGSEAQAENLKQEIEGTTGTDMSRWNFVFLSPNDLQGVFKSLNLPLSLDSNLSNPFVFIIDRDVNLRGRDDDDFFGYDARSVADINNNMVDDVKVILAEYRLALKKYNQGRKP
ncbi:MAG: hypothetical protein O2810_01550 [Bacteroidetes bacterium]|nr:hypothetical protein [Bacteroidota bacterium]MDA0888561.1 hypothetical protein [Bacteroidota bacterium]MDA1084204.1 hypothetical protein [Bacteroidota bacterium]